MTRDDPTPADALAAAFSRQVRQWSIAAGAAAEAADVAAAAARALSLAVSSGHVCWRVPGYAGGAEVDAVGDAPAAPVAIDRASLLASRVVGTPAEPGAMPLILDEADRLYLHRDHDHESTLAAHLRRLAEAHRSRATEPGDAARQWLQRLAPGQAVAVALALRQRLLVLSGGPGTGKTTTVVNLLACLLLDHPTSRIALAAPTGKAAARLAEAIRERAASLPADLRNRLPGQTHTVHRLLGVRGDGRGFVHSATRPLDIDLLVVDEASMLDLALARRLFDAVPPRARVVLLGDKDQLSAVESGAVFAEIGASPRLGAAVRADLTRWLGQDPLDVPGIVLDLGTTAATDRSPLADSIAWLTNTYRFGATSGIGRLAERVRDGQPVEALDLLERSREAPSGDLQWLPTTPRPGPVLLNPSASTAPPAPGADELIERAWAGYQPLVDALLDDPTDATRALAAFQRFRVLCATRQGPFGTAAVNAALAARLQQALSPRWPVARSAIDGAVLGMALIVLRNDHGLQVFNGDLGLVLPGAAAAAGAHGAAGLSVVFPQADGRLRRLPVSRLPEHDTAFAMTVHKAQGSEFDEVLVALPPQPSRACSRELLYTAVTRARQRVTLAAPAAVVEAAILSPTRRESGLRDRL
jgi:exodeoxyribonuclease V alpha subunit